MAFQSISQLLAAAGDKPLWQAVLEDDCRDRGVEGQDSLSRMTALWAAMKQSVADYDPARRSASGLSGGQAAKMEGAERTLCGPFLQQVMATALKVGEHNACMGRIVAAPTAGASGVMPAVLIPLQEKESLSDESMVQCLYVAAGFGQVIAARASISGAEGAVRRRWAPPPAWPPPLWSTPGAARRSRWPPPAPWPCRTCWGWCATRWPVWWRPPVSSATSWGR